MTTQYRPSEVSPPGETLLEILQERGLSQADLAARMQRPAKTINEIVRGTARITPETALQLESTLEVPAAFWLAREAQYREWRARAHQDSTLVASASWLRELPVRDMRKLGWIPPTGDIAALVRECLKFFGVATVAAWREEYQKPLAAFRTSRRLLSAPGAVAAWLRRGELVAQGMRCGKFTPDAFKSALSTARNWTLEGDPAKFVPAIQAVCCAAGVAVVVEPAPTGCRASGVTRWLSPDVAMLALSLRYKSDDHLWFTFFHEAGHILLHSKKAVFVEGDASGDLESEADSFARDWLIPPVHAPAIASLRTADQVRAFGKAVGVSPGIVIGRLQHEGQIPWRSPLNQLKRRYRWVHD